MLVSMTGFGRATYSEGACTVSVEARTLNHRFSDIVVKAPRLVLRYEERIRKVAQQFIERGRLEISISVEGFDGKDRKISLDRALLEGYLDALHDVERLIAPRGGRLVLEAGHLLSLPELFTITETDVEEDELWPVVEGTLREALKQLAAMRRVEGEALYREIASRLGKLHPLIDAIEARLPGVIDAYRERLQERIKAWEAEVPIPADRVAAEVVLFAEKSNVAEELTRLRSHVGQIDEMCRRGDSVGRKLDFMLQEVFRELNTIASKVHDQAIVGYVVEAKAEVEKVREQVQNVE